MWSKDKNYFDVKTIKKLKTKLNNTYNMSPNKQLISYEVSFLSGKFADILNNNIKLVFITYNN